MPMNPYDQLQKDKNRLGNEAPSVNDGRANARPGAPPVNPTAQGNRIGAQPTPRSQTMAARPVFQSRNLNPGQQQMHASTPGQPPAPQQPGAPGGQNVPTNPQTNIPTIGATQLGQSAGGLSYSVPGDPATIEQSAGGMSMPGYNNAPVPTDNYADIAPPTDDEVIAAIEGSLSSFYGDDNPITDPAAAGDGGDGGAASPGSSDDLFEQLLIDLLMRDNAEQKAQAEERSRLAAMQARADSQARLAGTGFLGSGVASGINADINRSAERALNEDLLAIDQQSIDNALNAAGMKLGADELGIKKTAFENANAMLDAILGGEEGKVYPDAPDAGDLGGLNNPVPTSDISKIPLSDEDKQRYLSPAGWAELAGQGFVVRGDDGRYYILGPAGSAFDGQASWDNNPSNPDSPNYVPPEEE